MEKEKIDLFSLKNGRYQVEKVLGAGGFGVTYKCVDCKKGITCVAKEYLPEIIASRNKHTKEVIPSEFRENEYLHGKKRFLEEADILMKMQNIPYIVRVWDVFTENNTAYYIMEYLDGWNLKQFIRSMGGYLPFELACEFTEKVGVALDIVHRKAGIFHRDVSPENIMVLHDGSIRLIDFGNAKFLSVKENQHFSVVLKPGFAPPEQYSSQLSQGSFTDVYALAGTFYYAASGKTIPMAPDRMMGAEYEPLERLVPKCSSRISKAVDRALLLDQKFRTQTISEFLFDIRRGFQESLIMPMKSVVSQKEKLSVEQEYSNAYMRVLKGSCKGKRFCLGENQWINVGRLPGKSQIILSGHPEISGLHFKLMYEKKSGQFCVIDQSSNGLYWKEIRLERGKKYRVPPGITLSVGSMRCMIVLEVRKDVCL